MRADTSVFVAQTDDGMVCDAFSFSDGGQILHCLPDAYGKRHDELFCALTAFFRTQKKHELFNIIGEEQGTELVRTALQTALGRTTQHEQSYLLLEHKPAANYDDHTIHVPLFGEPLTTVHCTPMMIDALLALQIAYEKEEVAWAHDQVDEKVSRLSFLHALRTQHIFAIAKNGAYIAKGGTNALGRQYAQLGGIYTVPTERGKGYATQLVRHITSTLQEQGKKCVLFVKPENVPAVRLYKTCGFTQIGRFAIAYF